MSGMKPATTCGWWWNCALVSSYLYSTCIIWVRSWNCGCLVTRFCYQLIAKPGNKTATVSGPDPYKVSILTLWFPFLYPDISVRETNACPLANASAFWAGWVETLAWASGILYRTYEGHLFSGECSNNLVSHTAFTHLLPLHPWLTSVNWLLMLATGPHANYLTCWPLGNLSEILD